jgi:hypothetical protein
MTPIKTTTAKAIIIGLCLLGVSGTHAGDAKDLRINQMTQQKLLTGIQKLNAQILRMQQARQAITVPEQIETNRKQEFILVQAQRRLLQNLRIVDAQILVAVNRSEEIKLRALRQQAQAAVDTDDMSQFRNTVSDIVNTPDIEQAAENPPDLAGGSFADFRRDVNKIANTPDIERAAMSPPDLAGGSLSSFMATVGRLTNAPEIRAAMQSPNLSGGDLSKFMSCANRVANSPDIQLAAKQHVNIAEDIRSLNATLTPSAVADTERPPTPSPDEDIGSFLSRVNWVVNNTDKVDMQAMTRYGNAAAAAGNYYKKIGAEKSMERRKNEMESDRIGRTFKSN